MTNFDIRKKIAANFLKHWQIAAEINIHEAVFCRWLRRELTPERQAQVLAAIEKLSKGGD
jgi:hypothetical protein